VLAAVSPSPILISIILSSLLAKLTNDHPDLNISVLAFEGDLRSKYAGRYANVSLDLIPKHDVRDSHGEVIWERGSRE